MLILVQTHCRQIVLMDQESVVFALQSEHEGRLGARQPAFARGILTNSRPKGTKRQSRDLGAAKISAHGFAKPIMAVS